MLNIMVQQLPAIVESLLPAILIYGIISVMYKRNRVFSVLQNFVLAVVMAQGVAKSLYSFNSQVLVPMVGGEWIFIIAFLMGVGYFTFLTKKYINIYRFIFLLSFVTGIGATVTSGFATAAGQLIGMGKIIEVNHIIYLIFFIAAITYFTFSKRLERSLRHVRTLGLAVILVWAGSGVATLLADPYLTSWQLIIIEGPGIWVIAIIGLGILLDILGVWDSILGRKEAKVTPTT